MNNLQDDQRIKLTQMLELAGATADEVDNMVAYVMGEKDATVLEGLPFRDLNNITDADRTTVYKYLTALYEKKHKPEYAVRFMNAAFAMGESTCTGMLPFNYRCAVQGTKEENGEPINLTIWGLFEIRTIVDEFLRNNNNNFNYYIHTNRHIFSNIDKPETFYEMYKHHKETNIFGKALILADYFMKKYPYPAIGEEKPLLSKIIDKLKGNKDSVGADDIDLMTVYEQIVIDKFNKMLRNAMSEEEADRVTNAIIDNAVNDDIKKLAKKYITYAGGNYSRLEILAGLAYMNYALSKKLATIAKLCVHMEPNVAFRGFYNFTEDIGNGRNLKYRGGDLDDELGFPTVLLIRWAAEKECKKILERQLEKNQNTYLTFMEGASMDISNKLMDAIQDNNKELFDKIMKEKTSSGVNDDLIKAIDLLISYQKNQKPQILNLIKDYLLGNSAADTLVPYRDEIKDINFNYGFNRIEENWEKYIQRYGDKAFARRTKLIRYYFGGYQFEDCILPYDAKKRAKNIPAFFDAVKEEGLDTAGLLDAASILCQNNYRANADDRALIIEQVKPLFYLDNSDVFTAVHNADAYARYIGVHIMGEDTDKFKDEILAFTQDTSKQVKEELLEVLLKKPEWDADVIALISSKKQAERELAVRVLSGLDANNTEKKYNAILTQALEKEKSDKLRKLIMSAMEISADEGEGAATTTLSMDDMVKELHKGNKKRTIEWAYETPFSEVHTKTGELATVEFLQAICLSYSTMEVCGVSQKASSFAEKLNETELAVYANEMFDKWLDKGAEAKKKWVLYFAAIHGGADIIDKFKHQINEWPQVARGAIAAEAVKALALNPSPNALLIVDGISRKFKFKQVKSAAAAALEYAAAQLGLTTEELADKIVPNLGFDEKCERVFDYGTRKFTVAITPALELMVSDENGKKLKNLPAVGQKDDAEIATAALTEYKQMKKQLKTTVTSQKSRLEFALATERSWTVEAWKDLFVKNPIMHQFAIGLIWGMYEDGKLTQTFRYMEDGSFNTEDEDEFELPETGKIGLVHPIELTAESRENWKQQLEDYEIKQPLEQLDREIFYLTEEEKSAKYLERFGGYILNDLSLNGKLLNSGWYRGSVQDAGGFYEYYTENADLGIGAELHFSGSFVGGYMEEDVTIYEVRFYEAGTVNRGSYVYDEVKDDKAIPLAKLPARYFSEIVLNLKRATASSKEIDEEWREHK